MGAGTGVVDAAGAPVVAEAVVAVVGGVATETFAPALSGPLTRPPERTVTPTAITRSTAAAIAGASQRRGGGGPTSGSSAATTPRSPSDPDG